jgi:hypothetical protein
METLLPRAAALPLTAADSALTTVTLAALHVQVAYEAARLRAGVGGAAVEIVLCIRRERKDLYSRR